MTLPAASGAAAEANPLSSGGQSGQGVLMRVPSQSSGPSGLAVLTDWHCSRRATFNGFCFLNPVRHTVPTPQPVASTNSL